MTKKTIIYHERPYIVSEETSLRDIDNAEPLFFKNRGYRETISMHRGFMIVRYTIPAHRYDCYSQTIPARRLTAVYLFDVEDKQTICILPSSDFSIKQAQKLIDNYLK